MRIIIRQRKHRNIDGVIESNETQTVHCAKQIIKVNHIP